MKYAAIMFDVVESRKYYDRGLSKYYIWTRNKEKGSI